MSVNCVNCQGQRVDSRKTAKRVANSAAVLAGVGATGLLLNKGIRTASGVCSDTIAVLNNSKPIGTKTGKIFNFFERIGGQIFKSNTKLGQAVERFVTGKLPTGGHITGPKYIAAKLQKCKTIGAMALTAGAVALGMLLKGQYNAGKIDAQ